MDPTTSLDKAIVEDYDFNIKIHSYAELENVVQAIGRSLKRNEQVTNQMNGNITRLIVVLATYSDKISQLEKAITEQKMSINLLTTMTDGLVTQIEKLTAIISAQQGSIDQLKQLTSQSSASLDKLDESVRIATQEIRSFENKVVAQDEREINKAIREFSVKKKKQKQPDPVPFHPVRSFWSSFALFPGQNRRTDSTESSSASSAVELPSDK
jgi:septal ring factor EnvC (AmiA/AmiB activator)